MAHRIFIAYSHADESLRQKLTVHLSTLVRDGLVSEWHDRRIPAGADWRGQINEHLEGADVVVFLVSPDFLASDYCHDVEMKRALQRAKAGSAVAIPVILRPCDWLNTEISGLQALPKDGRPITTWANRDEAWQDVATSIRSTLHGGRLRREGALQRENVAESEPTPAFADVRTKELSERLSLLYQALEATLIAEEDATPIYRDIAEVKRQLREGGRLEAGDFLAEGRYKLIELLGSGGFAEVWKAYDSRHRAVVALKALHAAHARDQSRVDRFLRGARVMFGLRHPGVVRVLEPSGKEGSWHFYVMDYVRDGDLRAHVTRGLLSPAQIIPIICEVARVLAFAHEEGMIHRDVSPANILLDGNRPVLTDFDLVRVLDTTGGTRTGAMGKFYYAAPELMTNASDVDERADIYSLAMTAVFCYWQTELPMDVVYDQQAFLRKLPCSLHVRRALEAALSLKRADRPETMKEFATLLQLADSREASVKASPSTARVLIVDDQRNLRATLAMLCRGNGYEVDAASTGREGLEMGVAGAYDVVLTDLRLGVPGEPDGIDILREIKKAWPSTEVIVMTAYGTIESAVEAMKLGAFDYIQKPFSEQELLVRLHSASNAHERVGQSTNGKRGRRRKK